MFSTVTYGYPAERMVRILMDPDLERDKVCHIQPMGVTSNATFIIDMDDVHFPDLKADDLGSWKPNGTKATYFHVLLKVTGYRCLLLALARAQASG